MTLHCRLCRQIISGPDSPVATNELERAAIELGAIQPQLLAHLMEHHKEIWQQLDILIIQYASCLASRLFEGSKPIIKDALDQAAAAAWWTLAGKWEIATTRPPASRQT